MRYARIFRQARRGAALVILALLGPLAIWPSSSPASTGEYAAKAAFLFYFAKFVTWPADSAHRNDPVVFGIFGSDPFGKVFDETLSAQTLGGRKIEVRRIARLEDVKDCRVLFVSSSEEARLPLILDALRSSPTLTVAEMEGFTARGGMIGFVNQRNKIRFLVNLKAGQGAQLKISSQLLELAAGVEGP